MKTFENSQFEKNSVAVNTSLEICNCNNMKQSSSRCNKNTSRDQIEENERLMYTWTNKKSKSSETVVLEKSVLQSEQNKEEVSKKEQEDPEFSETLLMQDDITGWDDESWDDPKSKFTNIWKC